MKNPMAEYHIGEEAAEQIIAFAQSHAEAAVCEPYQKSVVGRITEITNAYILIDDSVLCKDPNDGIIFKIMLNDLRINRHVETDRIAVGDLVQIVYQDTVDTSAGYVIDSAVSASVVFLQEGSVMIPE